MEPFERNKIFFYVADVFWLPDLQPTVSKAQNIE